MAAINLPPISVPLTDSHGRIAPVWHEFFRRFLVSSVDGTVNTETPATTIVAGNGLTSTTSNGSTTLVVGQGNGIAVNADDVAVDINGATEVQAALNDYVLLSDTSDNNAIRKTQVRDIMELSAPGGDDTYVQYNDNGIFGGDSGLTYDSNILGVDTITPTTTNADLTLDTNGTGLIKVTGTSPVITGASGDADTMCVSFASNSIALYGDTSTRFIARAATGWTIQSATGNTLSLSTDDVNINGLPFKRDTDTALTASTTQTQGQGARSADYNFVTTVANVNDTITLPAATASRYCFVSNAGANIMQVFPASGDDLGNGVNVAASVMPGTSAEWIAIDTTTWRQTVGSMVNSVKAGITASTTQTQGQMPLTLDVNEISVCANANDTVTMPSAPVYSRSVKIINNGANTLQIFPASGDNLGAGLNTAVTLASGSNVCYTNIDSTNWENI